MPVTRCRLCRPIACRTVRGGLAALAVYAAVGSSAPGQSFNIDLDTSNINISGWGVPASGFAGAGSAGVWNALLNNSLSAPLVRLDGTASSATVARSTSLTLTGNDNANTTGNVQLLMDDYQRFDSVPFTVTVSGLQAGHYRVITYANRVSRSAGRSAVSVANSVSANPQIVGGALTLDTFIRGVTHAEHVVALSSAGSVTITMDNSPPSESGAFNGLQLVHSLPTRLYVDASKPAGGDGLSWGTALNDLQGGLTLAASLSTVTEVWVAAGTYRPAGPGGPRTATFVPIKRLYGGFAGTETALSQRNIAANPTVLSGDLNGNDTAGFGARSDNVYHVLTAGTPSTGAVIDGLTVRGGHADGVGDHQSGAGLYISDPFALLVNNCTFTDNYALNDGAGVYVLPTSVSPTRTIIVSRGNFVSNWAVDSGAAVRFNGASSGITLHLINCQFLGNISTSSGAVHMLNGTLHMVNCLVASNLATQSSGVVLRGSLGSTSIRNCTIVHNLRLVPGVGNGLILLAASGTATLANSIVRFNDGAFPTTATSDVVVTSGTLNVVSTSVTGVSGPGVVGSTPLFLAPLGPDLVPATLDENYRLMPASDLVDRGDITALPVDIADLDADGNTNETIPFDLSGVARSTDSLGNTNNPSALDLGCFELNRSTRRWQIAPGTLGSWTSASSWLGGTAPNSLTWTVMPPTASPFVPSRVSLTSTPVTGALSIAGSTEFSEASPGTGFLRVFGAESPALTVGATAPGVFMYAAVLSGRVEVTGSVRIGDRASGTSGQFINLRPSGLGLSATGVINVESGVLDLGVADVSATLGVDVGSRGVITSEAGRLFGPLTLRGDAVVFPHNSSAGRMTVNGTLELRQSPLAGDPAPEINLDVMPDFTADSVVVNGASTLTGGSLRLSLWPGTLMPPVGSEWTLISASSRVGVLQSAFLPGDGARLTRLVYEDTARSSVLLAQVDTRTNVQSLNPPIGFLIPGSPSAAAIGKIRNDGLPLRDLAVVVPDSGNPTGADGVLKVLLNQGVTATAWNGYAAIITNFATQRNPSGVCIADFNADGFNDVAVCNRNGGGGATGSVSVFRNNGAGSLVTPATVITTQIGTEPSAIAAGDIDGDGKPDLAVTNAGGATLSLLRNTSAPAGAPAFTSLQAQPIEVGLNPVALFIADVDKDGDNDIGVANRGSDTCSMIYNQGVVFREGGERAWNGFQPVRTIRCEEEPSSIQPGNIDNGKDDEIVVANAGSGSVSVLLRGADGSYSAGSGPIGAAPSSVALIDIDNDPEDRLDIVAVTQDSGTSQISVLQTELGPNGEILLTQSPDINPPDPPTLCLADDVNGDGTTDLIAVNPDTATLRDSETGEVIGTRGTPQTVKVQLNYKPCPADLNYDRSVNTADLTFFLGRFGQTPTPGSLAERADFNKDGAVNTVDLIFFLGRFSKPCPS